MGYWNETTRQWTKHPDCTCGQHPEDRRIASESVAWICICSNLRMLGAMGRPIGLAGPFGDDYPSRRVTIARLTRQVQCLRAGDFSVLPIGFEMTPMGVTMAIEALELQISRLTKEDAHATPK